MILSRFQVFFAELPHPLLDALPVDDHYVVDQKQSAAPFLSLSPEAMSLFVWMMDLMSDVIKNAVFNKVTITDLVEKFAPCLHDPHNLDKVTALLYYQLVQSCDITANSQRVASIQQLQNHFQVKARAGRLIPSQSFHLGNSRSSFGKHQQKSPTSQQAADREKKSQEQKDPDLPAGWKKYTTKTPRQRVFYHNADLNRTQWHPPGEDAAKVLPQGWTIHRTKTPRRRVFYHHKEKAVTQWNFPAV